MTKSPLVFVDVDTQRDFLDADGSLSIRGAESIRSNLRRLTEWARERGVPVLATACAHNLDEEDPEPFPPHCLVGTSGQERAPETHWPGSVVVPADGRADLIEGGGLAPHLTIEKRRYDVFSHSDADRIVSRYGQGAPTFVVYGVATDYCVRCAVLGLLERGHRVAVVEDAVRAVDESNRTEVFAELAGRGATLTTTEEVCSGNG